MPDHQSSFSSIPFFESLLLEGLSESCQKEVYLVVEIAAAMTLSSYLFPSPGLIGHSGSSPQSVFQRGLEGLPHETCSGQSQARRHRRIVFFGALYNYRLQ